MRISAKISLDVGIYRWFNIPTVAHTFVVSPLDRTVRVRVDEVLRREIRNHVPYSETTINIVETMLCT